MLRPLLSPSVVEFWNRYFYYFKELMVEFYRRIWIEKQPKCAALWEAKRALRDAKDDTGAPKYATRDWAGWILVGDPH